MNRSVLHSFLAVYRIGLRRIASGKRLWFVAVVFGLPVLLTLAGAPMGAEINIIRYIGLTLVLYCWVLVPLACLLYATGLVREEQEARTLTYLLIKPIPRWMVLTALYLAAVTVIAILGAAGLAVTHLSYWAQVGGLPFDLTHAGTLGWMVLAVTLASVAFCAIFALIGVLFRRALIAGLVYGFFIEVLLTNVPALVGKLSVMYYVRSLVLNSSFASLMIPPAYMKLLEPPGVAACVATLFLIAAAALAAASVVFSLKEFVGEPTQ